MNTIQLTAETHASVDASSNKPTNRTHTSNCFLVVWTNSRVPFLTHPLAFFQISAFAAVFLGICRGSQNVLPALRCSSLLFLSFMAAVKRSNLSVPFPPDRADQMEGSGETQQKGPTKVRRIQHLHYRSRASRRREYTAVHDDFTETSKDARHDERSRPGGKKVVSRPTAGFF